MGTTKKSGFTILELVIVIAVIAALVGAVAYERNQANKTISTSPTPIVSTSPTIVSATTTPAISPAPVAVSTATPDPTTGWKSYANKTFAYTIKYPNTWFMDTSGSEANFTARAGGSDAIGGDTGWANYNSFNGVPGSTPADYQYVNMMVFQTSKTPTQYFDSIYNVPSNTISNKTTTSIGGHDALQFSIVSPQGMGTGHIALVKVTGGLMVFNYTYSPSTGTDDTAIFNMMVASLSFAS